MFYVLPCVFVLVFFSPFSIAITSLEEERANLSAFRTFVRFVLVWICWFPLPVGVWEGLRFMIVALPGLLRVLSGLKLPFSSFNVPFTSFNFLILTSDLFFKIILFVYMSVHIS